MTWVLDNLDLIWSLTLDHIRQSVIAIETGKYDPSLPLAFKIARLLGMPIEKIFKDGK